MKMNYTFKFIWNTLLKGSPFLSKLIKETMQWFISFGPIENDKIHCLEHECDFKRNGSIEAAHQNSNATRLQPKTTY